MEGWIKLHRKLQNNKLWTCEPFTRGQAWVDLLLLANHADSYFYLRDHKIDVKRGQVGWSILKLSTRWKWSRSKTKKFLNDLEKEQQVKQQLSHSTSIIEIINYGFYQVKEQQGEQQKDNRKTTERQQKDTNKNDKNVKNYKNTLLSEINSDIFDKKNQEYFDIALTFQKLFIKNLFEIGIKNSAPEKAKGTWVDDIRMIIEIDKRTLNEIRIVYEYIKKNEFWKKNILSTSKLRKQFEQILIKAKYENKQHTNLNPIMEDKW